jgi:AcrR family transcriptional regulator
MSWRKDSRGERGYHHGNLKEALLQAALGLIAEKGPAGFTFADAARTAGVSAAAPYRHFRDRDDLLASIAQRGFEQFELVLTAAWDDGRPNTVTAFERIGKAYLAFARTEPAFYSAMFESGIPVDSSPELAAAGERAFGVIRAAAERLAALDAARCDASAGDDDGAAYLVAGAWRGLAVRPRRCRAAQAADVAGRSAGGRRADLFARTGLSNRPKRPQVRHIYSAQIGSLGNRPKIIRGAPLAVALTKSGRELRM